MKNELVCTEDLSIYGINNNSWLIKDNGVYPIGEVNTYSVKYHKTKVLNIISNKEFIFENCSFLVKCSPNQLELMKAFVDPSLAIGIAVLIDLPNKSNIGVICSEVCVSLGKSRLNLTKNKEISRLIELTMVETSSTSVVVRNAPVGLDYDHVYQNLRLRNPFLQMAANYSDLQDKWAKTRISNEALEYDRRHKQLL